MATAKVTKLKPAAKPGTSVAVATKRSGNVVSIREALAKQAAGMSERTAPASGNAIRVTQDKQFQLPDGTKTPGPIDLVIVDFAARHNFYQAAFDPKNIESPVCFAIGSDPRKMVPSENSPLKQAVDCQTCPNNQFGSDGNGKACKNERALAVLPPDADADTPMWTLKVSPTALKGFDGFVTSVARMFQTSPVGVIASVGFDPNVTYAKLVFTDPRPNENLEVHYARQSEAQTMLAQEPDVSGFEAKPKATGKRVAGRR